MTAALVMSITDELIAELEAAASYCVTEVIRSHPWSEQDFDLLRADERYVRAASPELVRALLAERAELKRDAVRYRHASKRESDGDVDICICKVGWNSSGSADYAILTGDNAHTAIDAAMQAAQ